MSSSQAGGFGPEHLPYGSARAGDQTFLATRLGDRVLDLAAMARSRLLPSVCDHHNLDRVLAAGPELWAELRLRLFDLVDQPAIDGYAHDLDEVRLQLPFTVGDYVDFYSSESHATNVGRMFRPDADPLLPNWKRLPVGYHGRSQTVVVSGSAVARPAGQRRTRDGGVSFGPSEKLDIELELGWVVGGESERGVPVTIDRAADHIFGVALLNDWSARDIQAWEYAPLGPFLGKSFATSLAAWVTPVGALDAVRVAGPPQHPAPFDYLVTQERWAFDLELSVTLSTAVMREAGLAPLEISSANFKDMYWTMDQQLAHLTVNGASVQPGDLNGSGTISGWDAQSFGSLLELTWNGTDAFELPSGETRTFLENGDEVVLRGATPDGLVTLGEVRGRIEG